MWVVIRLVLDVPNTSYSMFLECAGKVIHPNIQYCNVRLANQPAIIKRRPISDGRSANHFDGCSTRSNHPRYVQRGACTR